VPDFWLEDATQDIAFQVWREGKANDVLAIRREAIDAARRYGPQGRYGVRPSVVPLETALDVSVSASESQDHWLAVRDAIGTLTPKERRALRRRLLALPMSNGDSARASAARRRLRRELGAA
jgi:hypothetical protein